MHNKKALSGLVLLKTIKNNTEKQKKERKWLEKWELDEEWTGWTRERTRWTRERSSWTRTVWFGSATKSDIKRLQRTVRTAERNICAPLPNLQDFYIARVRKRVKNITLDPTHPSRSLRTVGFWSVLQSTNHQNNQAQEQCLNAGYIQPEQS